MGTTGVVDRSYVIRHHEGGLVRLIHFRPATSARLPGAYFLAAWVFILTSGIAGYVNSSSDVSLYLVALLIVKPWMTLIGIPWLMLRTLPLDAASIATDTSEASPCCNSIQRDPSL